MFPDVLQKNTNWIEFNHLNCAGIIFILLAFTCVCSSAGRDPVMRMAPEAGFEPTTCELTARCSTVELFGIIKLNKVSRSFAIY
jgi:hypothetical protein